MSKWPTCSGQICPRITDNQNFVWFEIVSGVPIVGWQFGQCSVTAKLGSLTCVIWKWLQTRTSVYCLSVPAEVEVDPRIPGFFSVRLRSMYSELRSTNTLSYWFFILIFVDHSMTDLSRGCGGYKVIGAQYLKGILTSEVILLLILGLCKLLFQVARVTPEFSPTLSFCGT